MTDDEPPTASRRHSWPRILVAAFLALSGLSSILYAGFLPLPPLSDVPVPIVFQVFGAAGLVAALGVYLGRSWGRWLAVVVVALGLVQAASLASAMVARSESLVPAVTLLASAFVDIVLLWWLGWRWSVEGRRG
jgi:hypothetical protein